MSDKPVDKELCDQRYSEIKHRVDRLEKDVKVYVKQIFDKLENIASRPSWVTVSIISFLTAVVCALITVVAMKG